MAELIDVRHQMADRGAGRFNYDDPPVALVWHYTAVFYPAERATPADEWAHVLMIEDFHQRQGYGVFGYHGIAFPSGRAYLTGRLTGARSHVASRNHEAVGFCFAGNDAPTAPQLAALRLLRREYVAFYDRQPAWEGGHTDFALPQYPTSCPGARRSAWIPLLADDTWGDDTREEDHLLIVYPQDGGGAGYRLDPGVGITNVSSDDIEIARRAGVPLRTTEITAAEFKRLVKFYGDPKQLTGALR